jgi:hypothetical protein
MPSHPILNHEYTSTQIPPSLGEPINSPVRGLENDLLKSIRNNNRSTCLRISISFSGFLFVGMAPAVFVSGASIEVSALSNSCDVLDDN